MTWLMLSTMTIPEVVGSNIRRARAALGLSQDGLGAALEPILGRTWSRQAVSIAEQGGREFNALEIFALGSVLKRPVSYFFIPPDLEEEIEVAGSEKVKGSHLLRQATVGGTDLDEKVFAKYLLLRLEPQFYELAQGLHKYLEMFIESYRGTKAASQLVTGEPTSEETQQFFADLLKGRPGEDEGSGG